MAPNVKPWICPCQLLNRSKWILNERILSLDCNEFKLIVFQKLLWQFQTPAKWWISYPCLCSEMNGRRKPQLRTMFCTSASPFWWMHIMELKRIILGRNSMAHHWIIRIGVENIQQGATMSFCTYNQLEVTTKTVSSIGVKYMFNPYLQ